jgi:hypothetical protein
MELEELEPSKLIAPQQDVKTLESWADRNGISAGIARAWANRGIIVPTVKLGKRRMVNSALLLAAGTGVDGMKTRYLVELCTLHGKTSQRRWSRVYFGQDKTDCQRWIKEAVVDLPSGPGRHFGLTQKRAMQL